MHSSFPTAEPNPASALANADRPHPWPAAVTRHLKPWLRRHGALAAGLAVVIVTGAMALRAQGTVAERMEQAEQAQRAQAALAELRLHLNQVDAAGRAGSPGQPLRGAAQERLDELRRLSAAQAAQYERLLMLAPLISQRLDALDRAAAPARGSGGGPAAGSWDSADDIRRNGDRIRALLDALDSQAQSRIAETRSARGEAAEGAWQWLLASLALAAAAATGAAWRLRGALARLGALQGQADAAEARLSRAAALHEGLLASPLAAVGLIDAEGRVQRTSPALARLLGLTPEALAGRPLVGFVPPEDQRKTERTLAQAAHAAQQLQHRLRTHDGRLLHLAWTLQPAGDDGTLLALPEDRSAAQAQAARAGEQAAALQAATSAHATEQARAEAAEHRLQELTGTLARCLKGPLAALDRLAENARADLGEQPAARPWAIVRERAAALQRMADDVLALGQVHAGHLPLQREAFDLWEVASDAVAAVQAAAARKGLAIRAELAEDLGYAHGDTRRVAQALGAVLRDALDAAPAGTLGVTAARTGPGRVEIAVRHDRAVPDERSLGGILAPLHDPHLPCPPERIAHLLGLAMAQGLAQRMGGELRAHWEPGGPCVLTLALPADELPGQAAR